MYNGRRSTASQTLGPAMAEDTSFGDILRRIRAGDEEAAAELVRRYESAVRIAVRMRLGDARLRRVLDSMDVCQSVLASFFVRAAAGQYDLERPEQLVRLLVTIARNKVAYQARRHRAGNRDLRRNEVLDAGARDPVGAQPSPSRVASGRELLAEVRRRLTPVELQVADLRAEGRDWAEIAATLGGTAEARRKQLARALDRVTSQFDLGSYGDE
jgi:RNA polymerase sigma factor (sigma-70 family)